MKNLFKGKRKIILLSVLFVLIIAGCKNYVDPETKTTMAEYIIHSTTTWGETMSEGWFEGIFIWPMAQLINFFGNMTDAGWGIIIATIVINLLIGVMSIKNQVSQQKMQMIQPEMLKINAKYEGKTDEQSKMRQAQEMQALYGKYKLNPFSSILGMFIQLPVLMSVYYAVQRAEVVIDGTFMGISLTQTPMTGFQTGQVAYIAIFLLMVGAQYMSMKVPQWIAKKRKENSGVKTKEYAQPKSSGPDQMKMMSFMSTGMIAFIGLTWPTAMSFYWLVSSLVRMAQAVIIDKFFVK